MLWRRILTGVIGVPLVLWSTLQGGIIFLFLTEALTGVGLWEMSLLAARRGVKLNLPLFLLGGLSLPFVAYIGKGWDLVLVVVLGVSFGEVLRFILGEEGSPLLQAGFAAFGLLYIGGTMAILVSLRAMSLEAALLAFLVAWVNDTVAYFVGITLGRHRLAPKISPHKSVEGALGGMGGVILLSFFVRRYFQWTLAETLLFGVVGSVMALLGDLAESAMKRDAAVKDSGWILPGHGGILDRFDSLFFLLPFLYLFFLWVGV